MYTIMANSNTDFLSYAYNDVIWDISKFEPHGGTTYSSGVLPKWSFNNYMIKASQGFEDSNSYSAIIEVFISKIAQLLGFNYVTYEPIYYKYNSELFLGCVTKLFDGIFIPYKDLVFKDTNDILIRLTDRYPHDEDNIVFMYINDFLWGNNDRHSKNVGEQCIDNKHRFFPVFDSGSTFWHTSKKELQGVDLFEDKAKLTSRTNLENVIFIKQYISNKLPFNTVEYRSSLTNIVLQYSDLLEEDILYLIINFVGNRLTKLEEVYYGSI